MNVEIEGGKATGPGRRIGVLFVCLGNICRSPLAEGVFRDVVRKAGLEERFVIDSAGTSNYHIGESPDPRTVATAARRGLEIRHAARQAGAEDLRTFDYVIAMDASNLGKLRALASRAGEAAASGMAGSDAAAGSSARGGADSSGPAPAGSAGTRAQVRLFREFDPDAGDDLEVPDPYFGGVDGFDTVHDMVERAAEGLLEHIRQEWRL